MKALSIKQPWAHLIASGIKDIENRTWKTKLRGTVYIHASAKGVPDFQFTNKQHIALSKIDTDKMGFIKSAIIGQVDIIDCVVNHPSIWAEKDEEINQGDLEARTIWNWVLANPVLYVKPILNVKGKLSFWEYTPEPCKHLNISRSDSLDECLDCGIRNY